MIFDELQELLQAGDRLDALVRSRIQHHGDAASYIYAGSHPGLMRELFAERERPLYGQTRPLVLRPLADADLADGLSHAERAVLAVVAGEDLPLLSERTLETYGVPKSTARAAQRRLVEPGDLHELDDGSSAVVDPFLADFARNRIPAPEEEE